jgi:hypothetical protein
MNVKRTALSAGVVMAALMIFSSFSIWSQNHKIKLLISEERLRQAQHEAEVRSHAEAEVRNRNSALHEELLKARREVADLETTAEKWHAKKIAKAAADTDALLNNRDPTKGLTHLENFQNAGQATPGTGFQSFVWAVTNDDAKLISDLCVLDGSAAEFAQTIIAEMPPGERPGWTEKQLAGLYFKAKFSQYPAGQITGEKFVDAQNVIVKLRAPGWPNETFPMRLGNSGWQVVVSEQQIEALRMKIPALLAGQLVELP